MTMATLEMRNPKSLKKHPLNKRIYGDAASDEFVARVLAAGGILEPLRIVGPDCAYPDGTIISGHRRNDAALTIGYDGVAVLVERGLKTRHEIDKQLVLCNDQRPKSNEQIAREFTVLKEIEEAEAKARQKSGKAAPDTEGDNGKAGTSADLAAAPLGVSADTAERLAAAVSVADRLEAAGKPNEAEEILEEVNEGSALAAAKVAVEQGAVNAVKAALANKLITLDRAAELAALEPAEQTKQLKAMLADKKPRKPRKAKDESIGDQMKADNESLERMARKVRDAGHDGTSHVGHFDKDARNIMLSHVEAACNAIRACKGVRKCQSCDGVGCTKCHKVGYQTRLQVDSA